MRIFEKGKVGESEQTYKELECLGRSGVSTEICVKVEINFKGDLAVEFDTGF